MRCSLRVALLTVRIESCTVEHDESVHEDCHECEGGQREELFNFIHKMVQTSSTG